MTKLSQGNLFFDQNRIKKMDRYELFLYWIKERHGVYKKKQTGKPKPWTNDSILQSNAFTNVYRELDKTTKWYATNIRHPMEKDEGLSFATICFRWFNLISTGELLQQTGLLENWNTKQAISLLQKKSPVFTGAFVISNGGPAGVGVPKLEYVCKQYIEPCWKARQQINDFINEKPTLQNLHTFLMQYPGFGGTGFMAAQVVCDLKYAQPMRKASDWWTWCSPGPGSIKGLSWLLTGKLDGRKFSKSEWREEIDKLRRRINNDISEVGMQSLHAQDLQNCCCELSKYVRILYHDGRSKRKYNGIM